MERLPEFIMPRNKESKHHEHPETDQIRKDLQASFPILGVMNRRKTVEKYEGMKNEPEAVPLLVEAAGNSNAEVAARAKAALESLETASARNALCELCSKNPNPEHDHE